MIAKRFSRADIWLIAQLTSVEQNDPHYPIAEERIVQYFERATTESMGIMVERIRKQLPEGERREVEHEGRRQVQLTLKGAILLAASLKQSFDVAAGYLERVLARVVSDIHDDDQRCRYLLQKCTAYVSDDKTVIDA